MEPSWNEENTLATITGWISICCWMVVFTPQIYKNYVNKGGEALSLKFLWIWLVGDLFNVAGIVTGSLLPTMLILAIYYTLADAVLIAQIYHYRRRGRKNSEADRLLHVEETENAIHEIAKCSKRWITYVGGIVVVIVSTLGIRYLGMSQYMGWCSALLYIGSRIPQIVKIARMESTSGLSLWMFLFGIAGNLFYSLSIVLQSTERDFLLKNASWLVGSLGTLLLDVIIGLQFLYHRD